MEKNHTIFITILSTFLLIGLFPISLPKEPALSAMREQTIIYVDDSNTLGPWDGTINHPFQRIQDGINVSLDNDRIYIFNGTYNESLLVNTSITLYGEKTTIINGNYKPNLITLNAEDIILQNLMIQNSGAYPDNAGLLLNSHHTTISNCSFYKTKTGILTQNTTFHTIENCTFYYNGFGINLKSAEKITIKDCTFAHNAEGLICDNASDILLTTSYFHTNGRTCIFNNCQNVSLIQCNISDNSVNHGGVLFNACSTMEITNSILRHNGINLQITKSEKIKIHRCTLSFSTHFTIVVDTTSTHINITHCDINDGFRYGIYIVDKSTVTLTQNNIYSNMLYGLDTKNSQCSTQDNYWGSPHGPSITAFGPGERIHMRLGRIKSYPWRTQPIPGIGANWTANKPYLNRTVPNPILRPIYFSSNDTDDDGAPDWWETKWGYNPFVWENHSYLDPDGDALNNIEECYTDAYGSNPFHKDIFLEIDWMATKNTQQTNKPNMKLIKEAEDAFEQHNISLHIDVGDYGGGEEIPYFSNLSCSGLIDLYWHYFLHNDMNNPRKGIFRYGIICDVGPDVNFPFMGWDQLDSFLISAEQLSEQYPLMNRSQLILKASIHHLGHTLGLLADLYDGIDNLGTLRPFSIQWFIYHNYKSSMNYWYKYRTFSYSDGTHGLGDFNDYQHLNFSFFKNTFFQLT
jgi:parallel beta-helix repeat protein